MQRAPIPVAVFGLGPMGAEIVRVIANKQWLRLVAAVDHDPKKLGREIAEIAGLAEPLGVEITNELPEGASLVCHATSSSLDRVMPQLVSLLERRCHVISTCEELAFPVVETQRDELDEAAKRNGVTLLGTGVNPGFVMDKLPLTLSAVCQEITSLEIHRMVNASLRREPLQRKIGVGMTKEEFESAVADGRIRPRGLQQSLAMLAHGLGVELDHIGEEIIRPVMAGQRIHTDSYEVRTGQVAGIHQRLEGSRVGVIDILLDLRVFVGAEHAGDRIEVRGVPDISLTLAGGIHGDRATAAIVANAIPRVIEARAGLLTMDELPISYR